MLFHIRLWLDNVRLERSHGIHLILILRSVHLHPEKLGLGAKHIGDKTDQHVGPISICTKLRGDSLAGIGGVRSSQVSREYVCERT